MRFRQHMEVDRHPVLAVRHEERGVRQCLLFRQGGIGLTVPFSDLIYPRLISPASGLPNYTTIKWVVENERRAEFECALQEHRALAQCIIGIKMLIEHGRRHYQLSSGVLAFKVCCWRIPRRRSGAALSPSRVRCKRKVPRSDRR